MSDITAKTSGGQIWPLSLSEDSILNDLEDDQLQSYLDMAVDFLWRWTEQRFGTREITALPILERVLYGSTFYGKGPYGTQSYAYDYVILGGACEAVDSFRLPQALKIFEIRIDGEVLPESAYRLEGSRLHRIDGQQWPLNQDPSFEIDYLRGEEVPAGGQIAAVTLAEELAKASTGDNTCKLPQRLQSITRQGVSIAVMDDFEDVEKGRTGIWIIDSWTASVRHKPNRVSVVSPDYRSNLGGFRVR